MRRVLYLYLPSWPIDRLRRNGLLPSANAAARRDNAHPAFVMAGPDSAIPGKLAWNGRIESGHDAESEPPFATVLSAGGRQILAAVNPAAAAKGIAAGLPLADALSFLPGLLTRPAELAEDAAALHRLAEWCGRYSPWTAPDFNQNGSGDGIKIEVTGSAHLWGGEPALAADLSARLTRQQIVHRLAIADTLGAAWAVARYAAAETVPPDNGLQKTGGAGGGTGGEAAPIIVPPGTAQTALAPLPIAALRLDPAMVEGLYRVGLRRVGDVLKMPRAALARRFGEAIARRLDQALDALPEPLAPLGEVPTRRVRLSLPEPIADPADLARAAERLAHDLTARLEREGMGVRRLDLGFHRVDGRVEHIRIGTARPSRDPAHLAKLMVGKLDTVDPGLGVEDVILAAFAVEPLAPEQLASPLAARRNPHLNPAREGSREAAGSGLSDTADLAPLFDRIGGRLGLGAVARLEARASHIPERASVAVPVTENSTIKEPRRPPSQKPPRPVRLFAPPEPVEAFWVLPDDPPFRFIWRHHTHLIAAADGPERVAEEWWLPNGQTANGPSATGEAPWSPGAIRDYYRVEDETGRRFWLFRAGLPNGGQSAPPPRWFVHGIFA